MQSIWEWMQINWWIPAIAIAILLIVVGMIIIHIRRKKQNNIDMARKVRKIYREQASKESDEEDETLDVPDGTLILIIYQKGKKKEELTLSLKESLIVGRSDLSDICFEDDRLSRQHFALEFDGKRYFVTDLDTTNGTYLNGKRINGMTRLKKNDRIRAGGLEIMIRW